MEVIDVTLRRLSHVPVILSNNQRFASWFDLREVFLWCPNPQCSVVLHALKCLLGFPESEIRMHACTQLEHLLFLKKFVVIPHGTLLVNIDYLQNPEVILVLYQMVQQKHTKSSDPNVKLCSKILTNIVDKYANTSFKVPLKTLSRKKILPSVRRVEHERRKDVQQQQQQDKSDDSSVCVDIEKFNNTDVLVPLSLLQHLVPHSASFLTEVVQLYVLGRCDQANLRTICKCDVVEGIQLTRFLAGQYGYDHPWQCASSNSLMMSWGEFWSGYSRTHTFVKTPTNFLDFSVVVLDCQVVSESNPEQANYKHQTKEDEAINKASNDVNKSLSLTNLEHMTANLLHQASQPGSTIEHLNYDIDEHTCQKTQTASDCTHETSKSNKLIEQSQIKIEPEENQKIVSDYVVSEIKQEPYEEVYENFNAEFEQGISDLKKPTDKTQDIDTSEIKLTQLTTEMKSKSKRGRKPILKNDQDCFELSQTTITEGITGKLIASSVCLDESIDTSKVKKIGTPNADERSERSKQDGQVGGELKLKARIVNKKSKGMDTAESAGYQKKDTHGIESDNSTTSVNKDDHLATNNFRRKLRPRVSKEEVRTTRYGRVLRSNSNNSAVPELSDRAETNKSGNARTKAKSATERLYINKKHSGETDSVNIEERMEVLSIEDKRQCLDMVSIDARACSLTDARHKRKQQKSSKSDTKQQRIGKNKIEVCIIPKLLDMNEEGLSSENRKGLIVMKQKKQSPGIANNTDRQTLKIGCAELNANIPDAFVTGAKSPMRRRSILIQSKSYSTTYEESKRIEERVDVTCSDEDVGMPVKQKYASIIPKKLELNLPAAIALRKPPPGQPNSASLVEKGEADLKPENNKDLSTKTSAVKGGIAREEDKSTRGTSNQNSPSPRKSPGKFAESPCSSPTKVSSFRQEAITKTGSSTQVGKLADEIVERLQKQASDAICSVIGSSDSKVLEDLSAKGKTFLCTRSENPSATDFMKEQVSLWRQNLEEPKQRLARVKEDSSYRLASDKKSMHTMADTNEQGRQSPSFKRALGAIISRSRPNSTEKTRGGQPATNPRKEIPREPSLHLDVKGYGSSTSTTPDIYDEFARKRRPKAKADIPKVKPKPVTKVMSPPLHLSITKKVPQTPPPYKKISTTPNYHNVGYTSTETKDQQRQCVSAMDGLVRQSYQHSEPCASPNLPMNSHFYAMKPSFSHVGIAAAENLNSNRYTSTCPMCVHDCNLHQRQTEKHSPEHCVKKLFVPEYSQFPRTRRIIKSAPPNGSFGNNQYRSATEEEEDDDNDKGEDKETSDANIICTQTSNSTVSTRSENGNKETDELHQKERTFTILDKMTYFVQNYTLMKTPQATKEKSEDECLNNVDSPESDYPATKSASSLQDCLTPRTFMSRVHSQIYFKVPDDDTYYSVTGNIVIPPQSDFYILTREGEYQNAVPDTKSSSRRTPSAHHKKCAQSIGEQQGVKFDTLLKVPGDIVTSNSPTTTDNTDKRDNNRIIEPSPHLLQSKDNITQDRTRNFKDVVEEKRTAKKKDEDEMSYLKFWSSANPDLTKANESKLKKAENKKKQKIVLEYLVDEDDQDEGKKTQRSERQGRHSNVSRIRPKTTNGVSIPKLQQNVGHSEKPKRPQTVHGRCQQRSSTWRNRNRKRNTKLEHRLSELDKSEPQNIKKSNSKEGQPERKAIIEDLRTVKKEGFGDRAKQILERLPGSSSSGRKQPACRKQMTLQCRENKGDGTEPAVLTSQSQEITKSDLTQQIKTDQAGGRDCEVQTMIGTGTNEAEDFDEVIVVTEVPQEDRYIDFVATASINEVDGQSNKTEVSPTGGAIWSDTFPRTDPSVSNWMQDFTEVSQETELLSETKMSEFISHSYVNDNLDRNDQKQTFITQDREGSFLYGSFNTGQTERHWLDAVACCEIGLDINSNSNSILMDNNVGEEESTIIENDHTNQHAHKRTSSVVKVGYNPPDDNAKLVGYLVDSVSGVTVTVKQSATQDIFLTATYPDGDTYVIPKDLPYYGILVRLHQILNETENHATNIEGNETDERSWVKVGNPHRVPVADIDAFRRAVCAQTMKNQCQEHDEHIDNESEYSRKMEQVKQEGYTNIESNKWSQNSSELPVTVSDDSCKSDSNTQQEVLDSETQMYLDKTATLSITSHKQRKLHPTLWPSTSEVNTFLREDIKFSNAEQKKTKDRASETASEAEPGGSQSNGTQSRTRNKLIKHPNTKHLNRLKQKLMNRCRALSFGSSEELCSDDIDTSEEEVACYRRKKTKYIYESDVGSDTDVEDNYDNLKGTGTNDDNDETVKENHMEGESDQTEDNSVDADGDNDYDDDDNNTESDESVIDDDDEDDDYAPTEDEPSDSDSSESEIDEELHCGKLYKTQSSHGKRQARNTSTKLDSCLHKHKGNASVLEKIRKDFQKKYDVKQTSTLKMLDKHKKENHFESEHPNKEHYKQIQKPKKKSKTRTESLVTKGKRIVREGFNLRQRSEEDTTDSEHEKIDRGKHKYCKTKLKKKPADMSPHQTKPVKLKYTHATRQDMQDMKNTRQKTFAGNKQCSDASEDISVIISKHSTNNGKLKGPKLEPSKSSSNDVSLKGKKKARNKSRTQMSASNSFTSIDKISKLDSSNSKADGLSSNSKAKVSASDSSKCNAKVSASDTSRICTKMSTSDSSIKKRTKSKTKQRGEIDESREEAETNSQKDDTAAAEGFIQTQMKYYEIIKNKSITERKEQTEENIDWKSSSSLVVPVSDLPHGIPVRGDRPITKAIADAEKALEGTGGMAGSDEDTDSDIHIIQDYNTCCTYQLVEDEDKIQLGGVAYFSSYEVPFIFINGYKFTPLKDVLTLFQPAHCVGQCMIPRKVLQQHKTLIKSFSTWDQVYKLDLIKMKQGPAITTGDMLLRLDTLISQLPELIALVVREHKNTTLKRSQHCNIKSYKQLQLNLAQQYL